MAKQSERTTKMTTRALAHALGLSDVTIRSENSRSIFDSLSKYTQNEQTALLRNLHVTDPEVERTITDPRSIFNLFQPQFNKIGAKKVSFAKLKKLAPEISKASSIRVSSIMSPNDLQTGRFIFTIENMEGLEEDTKQDICQRLDTFFNDVLKLGKKAEDWCNRALYGVGSVPIFIYPSTAFLALKESGLISEHGPATDTPTLFKNINKPANGKQVAGYESIRLTYLSLKAELDKYYTINTFNRLRDKPLLSSSNESFSFKLDDIDNNNLFKDVCRDLAPILNDTEDNLLSQLTKGLESTKVTLTKEIEEGDTIKLTENPEIIKFANEYRRFKKQKINSAYQDYLTTKSGSVLNSAEYKPEELISFLKYSDNNLDETGHPFWMVLPSEAVRPITVQGNPKETLGYLILIDENGYPLEYTEDMDLTNNQCCGGKVDAAYQAMFQKSCRSFGNTFNNHSRIITATLFNHLMDGYFKAKLNGMGIDSLDVEKVNTIASVMLSRLLLRKKTTIVYVPPMFMQYICFDYHEDGTGKSLIDDLEFPLSLKTTYLVAAIMAMANDSINHHTINLTFDDKTTNYEQLMEQVTSAYIDKKKMNLSLNPEDISTAIARRSVTLSPKNMSGIQGFEVSTDTTPGNSVQSNSELLDKLDSMITSGLGVPHAALNNLDEAEYSRSILTSNLFFSKQIASDQTTLCGFITDFIRTFVTHSKILKKEVVDILVKMGNVNQDTNKSTISNALVDTDTKDDYGKQLALIVSNIKVSLPNTGAAPDRAMLTELQDYFNNIDSLANVIFSDEIIPSDDSKARDMLKIIRAQWKRKFGMAFFSKLGISNTITIPTVEDVALEQKDYHELLQALNNMMTGLEQHRKIFTPHQDGSSFGGGGEMDSGGFGGDDFGDSGEFGFDEGGDMSGDMGENTDMNENPTDTNESSEDSGFGF